MAYTPGYSLQLGSQTIDQLTPSDALAQYDSLVDAGETNVVILGPDREPIEPYYLRRAVEGKEIGDR